MIKIECDACKRLSDSPWATIKLLRKNLKGEGVAVTMELCEDDAGELYEFLKKLEDKHAGEAAASSA